MGDKKSSEKEVLYVQMFGGFSMTWEGVQIAGSSKTRESQFAYLMQLLLHYRKEGVSRTMLEEVLFEDREISNTYNALRSVIYNAKKKLEKAGLPDVLYIEQKQGNFYWTDKIEVSEDSARFERLCKLAGQTEKPEEKLEYLLEACDCYSGEFLPQQIAVLWASREARRFQEMFFSCVEEAAGLLRKQGDFLRLHTLGIHASKVSPFADWEILIMEALGAMGHFEEARKLYNDTVELYTREQGVQPSGKLRELLEKLGEQMSHPCAVLDSIQAELLEEQGEKGGGYLCVYPVFQGICHMVRRMMERGGQSVYLMLCTITDSRGRPMKEGALLEEMAERLEQALCRSVRHGDCICRYGRGQYLALLVNITRENCKIVQKRINDQFIIGRQRIGVKYQTNNILCFPEP